MENLRKFISNRVSVIRNAHNISARKLSMEMGQASEYINQIENGRKMPSVEGLFNFCNYFDISLSDFFDGSQTYPVQYAGLIKELNKLDTDELENVIKIVSLIARNKKSN